MENTPESKFGFRDALALIIALGVLTLSLIFLPDQKWLTRVPQKLLIIKAVSSFVLAAISYFSSLKFLIPSDQEIIDLDVKRQIDGGLKEIKEDAIEIQSLGNKISENYSKKVIALGETIERIHDNLVNPDLVIITEIEGKLYKFVNLLSIFSPYTYKPGTPGAKRTNKTTFEQLKTTFESALDLTILAMDNLEQKMNTSDLSGLTVLKQTLEKLYEMDGLLTSKKHQEDIEKIKRSNRE